MLSPGPDVRPVRDFVLRTVRTFGFEIRRVPGSGLDSIPLSTALPGKRGKVALHLMNECIMAAQEGKAKDGQDILAGWLNDWRPGYFVDVGAQDGVRKSNSWLLENRYGWSGICVEANSRALDLLRDRRSVLIDDRAVCEVTGAQRVFYQRLSEGLEGASQLSEYARPDGEDPIDEVLVKTVTLRQLLIDHEAPERIDYLSLDIEGAEMAALFELPDLPFRFSLITCEHNHRAEKEQLRTLLESAGYRVVLEELSRNEFWAVDESGPFANRFSASGQCHPV